MIFQRQPDEFELPIIPLKIQPAATGPGTYPMDIKQTQKYYGSLTAEDLCSCDYCRNYYKEIKGTYPILADCLQQAGIDIEKPFDTWPLDPDEDGYIEYITVQYVVMGDPLNFRETDISGVHICLAESHPMTDISDNHFVIEISPIKLKWTI